MQTVTSFEDDFSTVGASYSHHTTLWINLRLNEGASLLPNPSSSVESSIGGVSTVIPSNFADVTIPPAFEVTSATLYILLASGCLTLVVIFFILAKICLRHHNKTMKAESQRGGADIEYPMDGVFEDRDSERDDGLGPSTEITMA